MRHKVYGKHLGRNKGERNALFKNLVRSLLLAEKINTTQAKAKSIRGIVDKVINQAKSRNSKYLLQQFFSDKQVIDKLINELAPRMQTRNSGYASIIKLGRRLGDNSMIVQMRLLIEEGKAPKQKAETGQAISNKTAESRRKNSKNKL